MVAAAVPAVELITGGVFGAVALVIVFGGVELSGGEDVDVQFLIELLGGGGEDFLGGGDFLCIGGVDDGAVGGASVAELAITIGGVDMANIVVEELFVGELGGVVGDLDDFDVGFLACFGAVVVFVSGVGDGAAAVAGDGLGDAVEFEHVSFDAPEAAACEDGLGLVGTGWIWLCDCGGGHGEGSEDEVFEVHGVCFRFLSVAGLMARGRLWLTAR